MVTIIPLSLRPLTMMLLLPVALRLPAQQAVSSGTREVQARVWSRDSARNIRYSDWKPFPTLTLDQVKGYRPVQAVKLSRYGGDLSRKVTATGYFRTQKIGGRWWIIDPLGYACLNMSVNSVRQGGSPNNRKAFAEKYGSPANWMAETKSVFDSMGFNAAGSWSDTASIRAYNRSHAQPLVYTTQLNLLGSFAQAQRKNGGDYPTLAYVFHPGFEAWAHKRAAEARDSRGDPALLGHFSDNELPFQNDLLREFLRINDPADSAYALAARWLADHKPDTQALTRNQREAFAGLVADRYYRISCKAIKAADPSHLYLGSRLHASAKYNPGVLAAAERSADIISINYYGHWALTPEHARQWGGLKKPFMITEFYTKGEDTGMGNSSGAGWLVKTQEDRGAHYQNFCLALLQVKNCVGWHWFRYQDNDPADPSADPSNNDSNKGVVNTQYQWYAPLLQRMKELNRNVYQLITHFDQKNQ